MGKIKDLTGLRFGSLIVVELASEPPMKNAVWKCKCDCGNYKNVYAQTLLRGTTKSCGCRKGEYVSKSKTKHGKSNTRLHSIWRGMQSRCMNENTPEYDGYGGRGIKICDEWLGKDGFIHFYNWAITNGYAEDLSIDRIDNNGNYEPSNCRWVTNAEQQRNKRNNVFLTYNGKTMTCAEWSRELELYVGTVNNRLHKGYSVEECLFGKKETAHKVPKKYRKEQINSNLNDCCNLRKESEI